jgi:hypothetical protein
LVLGTIAAIGEYTGVYLTAVDAVGILTPMMTVVLISVIKVRFLYCVCSAQYVTYITDRTALRTLNVIERIAKSTKS